MAQSPRRRPANDRPTTKIPVSSLRDQILQHFQTLKIPLTAEQLDETLSRAEREGLSHLEFVHGLVSDQASSRRERSIARRIDDAKFRDPGTLAKRLRYYRGFDLLIIDEFGLGRSSAVCSRVG